MKTDVLIAGVGSAGFAAAYRFLSSVPGCASLVLADPNPGPGGTSVFGGVCCWEPGRSGPGVHHALARRLLASGEGFVGKTTQFVDAEHWWAVSSECSDPYESTLRRHGVTPEDFRRFHFDPAALSREMGDLLAGAASGGHELRALYRSQVLDVETRGSSIVRVRIGTPEGELTVEPRLVIDCTGGALLASAAGEETVFGEEPSSAYGEPSAPAQASGRMNGITLCFKIVPCSSDAERKNDHLSEAEEREAAKAAEEYARAGGPVACWNACPGGGYVVNMLPTAPGEWLTETDPAELRRVCEARAYGWWRWLGERFPAARGFRIVSFFPALGIRENRRLIGRYVLREGDLSDGFASCGAERTVAVADHPADIHGSGGRLTPTGVYGIPYDCLLPRKTDNLLVAGMSASFSHIAASSARLSRTMLELGEAAGAAAALSVRDGRCPGEIGPAEIRAALGNETVIGEIATCRRERTGEE